MAWKAEEALAYYQKQGAPADQNALIGLLKEFQREFGYVPAGILSYAAEFYGIRESLLIALIRRISSLRTENVHCLELCAGPNCGKHRQLTEAAEALCKGRSDITLKNVPCMRLCGKGPNIRWDGRLYHKADETLLEKLIRKNS